MNPDKYQYYLDLKANSPKNDKGTVVIDDWFIDFLKDSPERWQFIDILNNTLGSSDIFYAIWVTKHD